MQYNGYTVCHIPPRKTETEYGSTIIQTKILHCISLGLAATRLAIGQPVRRCLYMGEVFATG